MTSTWLYHFCLKTYFCLSLLQATGCRVGLVLQNLSNIIIGLTVAMLVNWKLTLFIMAFIPFVIITGAIESRIFTGAAKNDKQAMEGAAKVCIYWYTFV